MTLFPAPTPPVIPINFIIYSIVAFLSFKKKFYFASYQVLPVCISTSKGTAISVAFVSLRLDSVISSGFRIGRSLAAQYVAAGKAAIDGLPCEKPDKLVSEGAKISVRGLGKIQLAQVGGETKKGRISVIIRRYV